MRKIELNSIQIIFVILIILFLSALLGYNSYSCADTSSLTAKLMIKSMDISLMKILIIKNYGFALLLFLGLFFGNISTFCLLIYNGFSWGVSYAQIVCMYGKTYAILSTVPHASIELLWIVSIANFSVKYSILFYKIITDSMEITNLIKIIGADKKYFITFILMIFLGILVEYYVTPYILTVYLNK